LASPLAANETAELLADVRAFIARFVATDDAQLDVLAAWAIHTWIFDHFDATGYLAITSPTNGSGKSVLLEVLCAVVASPSISSSISPSAMFRRIDRERPTLMIDEVDEQETGRKLTQVINSGWRRHGGKVTINVRGVDTDFVTYCPKVLAGIYPLPLQPPTLSRCIPIRLYRRLPDQVVERFHRRDDESSIGELRARLSAFSERFVVIDLTRIEKTMPEMDDRKRDNWLPLFAVAHTAGRVWRERLAMVASEVTDPSEHDEPDRRIALLADIRQVFDRRREDEPRIRTKTLLRALAELKDSKIEGPRIRTDKELAGMLRGFGIAPKQYKSGAAKYRGYEREMFVDAWRRYLR
jgi:hypothetical protein